MTWVAWRQHRVQIVWGAALLAALAAFLVPTGLGMAHEFSASGLARCLSTAGADCGDLSSAFDGRYSGYAFLVPLFLLAPALFGMFFGAPLIAREMDGATYRLAWTQSVTRTRWLTGKLLIVVGSALAGAVMLAYVVTWWSRPLIANSSSRFHPGIFDLRGVVPVGYTIFAVMLGAAIGSIIKKTLAAVAVTLVAFAGVRVAVELFLRQRYMTAKTMVQSFAFFRGDGFEHGGHGIWVLSDNTVDKLGRVVAHGGGFDFGYLAARCPAVAAAGPFPKAIVAKGGIDPIQACVRQLGLRESIVYQPASRFWTFQWIELAIFIALAVALFAFTWWRTKRLG
jgi:hypothetical protein